MDGMASGGGEDWAYPQDGFELCIFASVGVQKREQKRACVETGLNYRMIELGLAVGCEDICDMCQSSLPVLTDDDWTVTQPSMSQKPASSQAVPEFLLLLWASSSFPPLRPPSINHAHTQTSSQASSSPTSCPPSHCSPVCPASSAFAVQQWAMEMEALVPCSQRKKWGTACHGVHLLLPQNGRRR